MSDPQDELTEQLSDLEHRLAHNAIIGEEIHNARIEASFILLFGGAKDAAIKARNALCTVQTTDPSVVRLQNDVARYEEMASWVRTALVEGKAAFQQLQFATGERTDESED